MIKVPCKITLTGDKDYARNFIGAAQSQMRILENQLTFQGLKQGTRKMRHDSRVVIDAIICFNLKEIIIYSEPIIRKKEEKLVKHLTPRFFAHAIKIDSIGAIVIYYYWIFLTKSGTDMSEYEETENLTPTKLNDDCDAYVWRTQNITMLEIMKNAPRGPDHLHKHPHRHTKSFMMDGRTEDEKGDDTEERLKRYVSASHILTQNRKIIFMPLHASLTRGVPPSDEICMVSDSSHYPIYPLPYSTTFYLAYNSILFTGLDFPCPPRRFYCNTEDGIMVWYTTNPTIVGTQNFICGVIYDIRNQRARTFMFYPEDGDGHGFDSYWSIDIVEAELPTPLLFDVQKLTKDDIDVVIAWSSRPINCNINFETSNITYNQIDLCNYQTWDGCNTGFNSKLFATLNQSLVDNNTVEDSGSMSVPYIECIGDDWFHEDYERSASRNYTKHSDHIYHSDYTWNILGNEVKIICDEIDLDIAENCHEEIGRCSNGAHSCNLWHKWRDIQSATSQQNTKTHSARWVCPNGVYLITSKDKEYCLSVAHQSTYFWGGLTKTEMEDMCDWMGISPGQEALFTVGKCFLGYDDMPGDDWNRIDSDIIAPGDPQQYTWHRETNQDDKDTDTIHEYRIDEDLEFSRDDVDHIYYLDDRATKNNQGVLVGGKGDSGTILYSEPCSGMNEYKPSYWEIYWSGKWDNAEYTETPDYTDVTEKLLEALNCKNHELIDLGLI